MTSNQEQTGGMLQRRTFLKSASLALGSCALARFGLAKGWARVVPGTKVAGEISTQYILRYVPETTENTRQLRAIKVTVDIPDVTVRTRRGYYPYAP